MINFKFMYWQNKLYSFLFFFVSYYSFMIPLYTHFRFHFDRFYSSPLSRLIFFPSQLYVSAGSFGVYNRCYSTKTLKSKNINLFDKLKSEILNKPKNAETQRLIEEISLNKNIKKLDTNIKLHNIIGMFNTDLKKYIINCEEDLSLLINNFISLNINDCDINNWVEVNKNKDKSAKDKATHLLNFILKELGCEFTTSVLLGKALKLLENHGNDNNTTAVFIDVGNYFSNNYFYALYVKERKKKIKLVSDKKNFEYSLSNWRNENDEVIKIFNNETNLGIGGLLIDWLLEVGLLKISVIKSKTEDKKLISIIESVDKLRIGLINSKKPLSLPSKLPMIVKPNKYERVTLNNGKVIDKLGGYLLNGEKYWNEVIINHWRAKENSKIEYTNIVYETVNNLSSIEYKLNKDVLDFIRLNDKRFGLTLIDKTHPIELKVINNRKIKLTKSERFELDSFKSKQYVEKNILAIADLFENIDGFYMPVRLDYRGRIYCEVDYLNYQGTDLAKSLLMFSRGSIVSKSDEKSIGLFKMYGTNCFGNKLDKKSAIDRVHWVDQNIDNIRDYNNGILISQAENKLLFIAFCIEYNKWLDCLDDSNSINFITHLPLQFDASCNGYQHISMLVKDLGLAQNLNLMPKNANDIPDDFYSLIGIYLKEYFLKKLVETRKNLDNNKTGDIKQLKEDCDSYNRLCQLDIQRSIIKKAIMTLPYNASSIQIIGYLKNEFEYDEEQTLICNKDNKNSTNNEDNCKASKNIKLKWYKYTKDNSIKLEDRDFIKSYQGIKYILETVFPSFSGLSKYFKSVAIICSKLGVTIPWYLPTGLTVNQSYLDIKETKIKPLNFSNMSFSIKVLKDTLHKDKQIRALMPNVIHSLDSTSLMLLINKYFIATDLTPKNIYSIHDCIAVTFNHMNEITNFLKFVYISIYSESSYLEIFHNDFINYIKNIVGDKYDPENLTVEIETLVKSRKIMVVKKEILKLPDIKSVIKGTYDVNLLLKSAYILN